MNGKNIEKILEKLSEENNGVLRTAEATSAGISKDHFYKYMKQKGFEKYAHGIYVSPDTLTDEKYLIQARFPKQYILMTQPSICMIWRSMSLSLSK